MNNQAASLTLFNPLKLGLKDLMIEIFAMCLYMASNLLKIYSIVKVLKNQCDSIRTTLAGALI